uniref:Uncharacterized protein n=1 Tax=Seriola dumerili TaxID=41447 RepID=A0A3B4UNY0_SERDU
MQQVCPVNKRLPVLAFCSFGLTLFSQMSLLLCFALTTVTSEERVTSSYHRGHFQLLLNTVVYDPQVSWTSSFRAPKI